MSKYDVEGLSVIRHAHISILFSQQKTKKLGQSLHNYNLHALMHTQVHL